MVMIFIYLQGVSVNISKHEVMENKKIATRLHSKVVDRFKHLENGKENVSISTDEEFEVIDFPYSNHKVRYNYNWVAKIYLIFTGL